MTSQTLSLFALLALFASCTPEPPPAQAPTFPGYATATYAPPEVFAPPTEIPGRGAFPPSGIYRVIERVLVDNCQTPRMFPAHAKVLTSQNEGTVPIPGESIDVRWDGYAKEGVIAPKDCPGLQTRFTRQLKDVSNTGFTIAISQVVADSETCPNARVQSVCRTQIEYDYRLETIQ